MEHGIVDCDSNTEVLSSLKILGTSTRSLHLHFHGNFHALDSNR